MKTKFLTSAILAIFAAACSFTTANMSSFKASKDKEGKQETTSFKAGETIYANAVISNSIGKTTTKVWLQDDKGKPIPGSEVKIDLPSSGTANYSLPIPMGVPGGKYTLHADMLDEKGEKKDGKTVDITIEGAPAAPPATDDDKGDDDPAGAEKSDGKGKDDN